MAKIHLDLFSGIGGFAYAADQVFGDVEHIFCDNDKFCQQILNKHWPKAKIYDDIRAINTPPNKTDLLTGGFPCQPFSAAGARRGTADDRHLWPEMLRVIRLTKPSWIIAENVRGLLNWNEGVVFEQVCADLEAESYEVWPFIIPAVAVNAPHRRDRVWFIANRQGERDRGSAGQERLSGKRSMGAKERQGRQMGRQDKRRLSQPSDVADTADGRCQEYRAQPKSAADFGQQGLWQRNWLEVATELCGMDDGLSAELDGFELTKAGHRKERLKSLGNAIVPQVAMEIMRGMV